MSAGREKVDIKQLIYPGQRIEMDCATLYTRLGLAAKPEPADDAPSVTEKPKEAPPSTDAPVGYASAAELPAIVSGRVKQVQESQFSFAVPKLAPSVWEILEPPSVLNLFIVDPKGMFETETRLLRQNPVISLISAELPESGWRLAHRRFIRVSIKGKAFLLHERVEEGQRESAILDLGGAGVRIRTHVNWLRPGEEMTLMIVTGFLDEGKEQHASLELTVPARVVWIRDTGENVEPPVLHVGFAFTEISIADQERLIGFLLAYEASQRE